MSIDKIEIETHFIDARVERTIRTCGLLAFLAVNKRVASMAGKFEFELFFAMPEGDLDPYTISDAVFDAGLDDPLVGTGIRGLLGVEIVSEGDDAESVILDATRALMKKLPAGAMLREVRPDLVSLADVAEKLGVKRQALQQRRMPRPSFGGLYRIDEIAEALGEAMAPAPGKRHPKFNSERADWWLGAGKAARRINARLTLGDLDPVSIECVHSGPAKGLGVKGSDAQGSDAQGSGADGSAEGSPVRS